VQSEVSNSGENVFDRREELVLEAQQKRLEHTVRFECDRSASPKCGGAAEATQAVVVREGASTEVTQRW
jgi:hypothetical protein